MHDDKKSLLTDAPLTGFKYEITPPKEIDWPAYLSLPGIELWKGIALTCGIDPSNPESKDPPSAAAAWGPTIIDGFQNRLDKAVEHVRIPGGLLEVKLLNPENRFHMAVVTLQSIFGLAKSNNWALPIGFRFPVGGAQSDLNANLPKRKSRRPHSMDAPFRLACERTLEPKTPSMIWATLWEMAENSVDPVLLDVKPKTGDEPEAIIYEIAPGKYRSYTYKNLIDKLRRENIGN